MKRVTIFLSLLIASTLWVFGCGEDAECVAGEQECVGMQVRVCTADGTWGSTEDCDLGTCMDMGQGPECMDMTADDDDDSSADDDDDSSADDDDDSSADDDDDSSADDDDDSSADDDDSAN